MTTIRERIAASMNHRADELEKINAPSILSKGQRDRSQSVLYGSDKMNGLAEFGDLEVLSAEVKTGRGGKQFVRFETAAEVIVYFPNAKYGAFLTQESK